MANEVSVVSKSVRGDIIAPRKEKIGTEGPPSTEHLGEASRPSLTKAVLDVNQIARVIAELDWLRGALELETASENDQSPQPARLQAIITELCDFLSCWANEETSEIPGDAETDGSPLPSAMPGMLGMTDASDLERVAAFLGKTAPIRRRSLPTPSRRPSTRAATRHYWIRPILRATNV